VLVFLEDRGEERWRGYPNMVKRKIIEARAAK